MKAIMDIRLLFYNKHVVVMVQNVVFKTNYTNYILKYIENIYNSFKEINIII